MKRVLKNTLRPTLAVAAMILGVSTVLAGPNERDASKLSISSLVLKPVIASDLGVAHLSAVVSAKGKLVRGSGVDSVAPAGGWLGDYIVTFNRNVESCTYVVSLGNTGNVGVPQLGIVSATGANVSGNGVYIDVNDLAGNAAEIPFHLNVFCNK